MTNSKVSHPTLTDRGPTNTLPQTSDWCVGHTLHLLLETQKTLQCHVI